MRRGEPGDRARILEISSQIWDGDNYGSRILDSWIEDRKGELAVASIHIIESSGFARVATFLYVERAADVTYPQSTPLSGDIRLLSQSEVLTFVKGSEFLALPQQRIPREWWSIPFNDDPGETLARLDYVSGAWEDTVLATALCIRECPAYRGRITINFLEGEPEAMRDLRIHAINQYASKGFEMIVPAYQGKHAKAWEVLWEL